MYACSYFTCKCNSKHFQIPRQSMCEWTVVFGPFLRSMPVSLGSWPIQHLTLRNFFLSKSFKKPVELFFPIQKGVFYIFFLKKWQINAISYLGYSAEQSMHQKDTHGIWVFDELQTSQLYVSCSAGSSDVQPFCSFLPRKTTEKPHKKSLGDFKMSAKWIQTAREISITPQIRLCFVPFFSFLVDIFLLCTK